MNQFMTISLFVLGAAQVILVLNFFLSMRRGRVAGPNPWRANTLEWQTSSPPPHENFHEIPTVYRGPYEFSAPERDRRSLAAERAADGGAARRAPLTLTPGNGTGTGSDARNVGSAPLRGRDRVRDASS